MSLNRVSGRASSIGSIGWGRALFYRRRNPEFPPNLLANLARAYPRVDPIRPQGRYALRVRRFPACGDRLILLSVEVGQ